MIQVSEIIDATLLMCKEFDTDLEGYITQSSAINRRIIYIVVAFCVIITPIRYLIY